MDDSAHLALNDSPYLLLSQLSYRGSLRCVNCQLRHLPFLQVDSFTGHWKSIDDLDESWLSFKKIIFKAAGQAIPRGNYKRPSPFFMHKSPLLQPLLKKRVDICREIKKSNNPSLRSSLNKINAEIKRTFIHLKREKWKELCKSIDAHTPNTKLWKLMKSLSITQPQQEECNTIIDDNGQISSDNKTSPICWVPTTKRRVN
ncbi:RNA-directed DNA polymerase from mobile element jockey [Trichonephila clavipes]|nr:RNA-directed DNA polymerase from mobile element jockey [Trichonephila clavipes]